MLRKFYNTTEHKQRRRELRSNPIRAERVEIDGVTQESPEQQAYDLRRTACINANNIDVIRFTDGEVLFSVDRCVTRIIVRIEEIK